MPELLPAAPDLVTTRAPTPGVSPAQVAQPYRELADSLSKAGEASESLAENAAQQAGYGAVSVGPDGKLTVGKAFIVGPASQEFAKTAKLAALAAGESAYRAADIKARADYINDPDGYLHWLNGYQEQTEAEFANQGHPDLGIAMSKIIGSTGDMNYRQLTSQKIRLDTQRTADTLDSGIASARDDALALARGGDTSSVQFHQAWDKVQTLVGQKSADPRFAYPAEKAAYDLDQFHGEVSANVFLHHVDQVYKDQGVNPDGSARGGALNALEAARSILTDSGVKLSEAQRQQYFAKATSEIRANEAMRRQDVYEARAAEQSLDMVSFAGGRVDPEDVETVARGYRSAGDPAAAARLYAKFARKPLNDDFGRQPFPEQLDQLRTLQNGGNPTSAAEARLINFESGGNPRSVNKLGYAGLYQFGAPLLSDLGLYKPGAGENIHDGAATGGWSGQKWSGAFDIPGFPQVKTLRDFLNSPQAQKAAFDAHIANMDTQINAQGLDKYIGQNVGGVPITREGLHAMIHLGGAEGTRVALQTNGRVNPHDANGTSLLDYARMSATGAQGTPSANLWLQTNRVNQVQQEARQSWKTVMADYDKTGIRPADAVLNQLVDAAHLTNDHDLLETMADGIDRMRAGQALAQAPLPAQGAAIGALQQAGAAGTLAPGQGAVLKDLERKHEAITKGLEANPIATTVQNFPDRFNQPAPLDLKNPDNLVAGLAQRAKIAQFAGQNWQGGAVSALDAADLKAVQAALANPDPAAKAQVYGAIATLPPDVRGATLKQLGGGDVNSMAEAAAGSLMRSAPDIATSIFRGQAAMKADKKWDPTAEQGGKASFDDDLQKSMPASIFPIQARTDPTGPYATFSAMVKARYADLSAQAGDTKYSADRVKAAVSDVTGGVLYHNGAPLIAPARGMTQGQFDGVLQGVTDRDLAGVTTLNGQPVTPDYLRNNATLQSAGDGRYFVTLGRNTATPIYAYTGATTEPTANVQKFVLDLRGRQPAPVSAKPGEFVPVAQ